MVQLDDPNLGRMLDEPESLPRMSFGDHLDELRKRVIRALLAIMVAVIAVIPFKQEVQRIIVGPYRVQWQEGFEGWIDELEAKEAAGRLDDEGRQYLQFSLEKKDAIFDGTYEYPWTVADKSGYPVPYSLYATGGLEDILSFFWASLIFSLVIASPVVIWQVWAFVAAGLYSHERSVFYRYFPAMIGLFAGGVWFGYAVALPYTLGFLIGMMDPAMVGAIFSVGQFFNLLFMTTAAMGVVFQVPLVMLALQKVGIVRHKTFIKHWRMTVLIMFLSAAIFSPPEPVSMLMMATPMILLYGIGLLLTRAGAKNERDASHEPEAA